MKSRLDRIISIATLLALLVVIGLMLKRSAPVEQQPKASAGIPVSSQPANPQSFDRKADQAEPAAKPAEQTQPSQAGGGYSAGYSAAPSSAAPSSAAPHPSQNLPAQGAKGEPHINSSDVSAAISQILGASAGLSPDSDVGSGAPNIKDQKVTYDGDTVHGQFLTEIGGKDVWITISGHMGQKDGYATFDPTEFKVGDVDVPVALVNPALQRKLAEERDRLKVAEPAK